MKRIPAILSSSLVVITLCSAPVSFAQQPVTQTNIVIKQDRVAQGPEGGPPPPRGDFLFLATDFNFEGKVVKGAPYSAEAVTETIQTLSDGNRIVNKITSQVYRDGEGRTRREQTLKGFGMMGNVGEPLQTIFINDPVAGVTYALDSRTHTAHKSAPFKFEWKTKPAGPNAPPVEEGQRFEFKVVGPEGGGPPAVMTAPLPPGALPGGENVTVSTAGAVGGATYVFKRKGTDANEVKEDLGEQLIEGVKAQGTRSTVTIPAGEIGNDRPIEIVSERWYSPELQTVIMTKHNDPRTGETTYKLTNINRSEPAKTLFEVPADYTVKEGLPGMPGVQVGPPVRVRRPNSPE
jgi:hypothetical protein